jgi:hypothetical protein
MQSISIYHIHIYISCYAKNYQLIWPAYLAGCTPYSWSFKCVNKIIHCVQFSIFFALAFESKSYNKKQMNMNYYSIFQNYIAEWNIFILFYMDNVCHNI